VFTSPSVKETKSTIVDNVLESSTQTETEDVRSVEQESFKFGLLFEF
jgi:hypothetical protein